MRKLFLLSPFYSILSSFWAVLSARASELQLQLSMPQKLYFVAILLLITTDSVLWVGVISVVAMSIEFWPLFERAWHSLAGKAVLLLFYAIVANFALASSSSVVNEVVGVAASSFNYTHNFAILLYIPAWSVLMSCIALLMLQLLFPLMFTVSFLLRPLGVKNFRLINHQYFHRSTFWVRIILAAVVLYHLAMLIDLYGQVEKALEDPQVVQLVEANADEHKLSGTDGVDVIIDDEIKGNTNNTSTIVPTPIIVESAKPKTPSTLERDREQAIVELEEIKKQPYDELRSQYYSSVRKAIALFAFHLEANVKSRCKKLPTSHVVELNDYEILEITPDVNAEYGYQFKVKKCVSPAFPS